MGIFDTVIKKLALLGAVLGIIFVVLLAASLGIIFVVLLFTFKLFICPFIDCRLPAHEQCEQKQITLQKQ